MYRRVVPNKEFAPFPRAEIAQSVAQRFEKQVEAYRDSLAVCDGSKRLTYGEFNAFANLIAHGVLAQQGVESEQVVLFFEQGVNFLGATFGVLKSGKCYVPIDPSFPELRSRYILEHSQARLVVTNHSGPQKLDR